MVSYLWLLFRILCLFQISKISFYGNLWMTLFIVCLPKWTKMIGHKTAPLTNSVEDELVWDHSKDGQFSVKSAYWLKFYGKFGTGTSNVQGHFSMWGIKCGVWVFLRNLNCLLEGRSLDFVCQRYIAQVENRGTPVLFSEWLTGWLKSAPNEEVVRGFCVIAFGYLVCTE
ncbi:uncharacterized protein LOC131325721 isoform X3 [Rhododendron vialii]|uniref:uncharacterized protein LOC131325721 isoform X3 n=1 Tax=Rhododendron vialii TaxID=182163 RepID=UPI00265FD48C|nr:uncharacterized protein LOC131325721 isoform X3 [Rhododendron vialii]